MKAAFGLKSWAKSILSGRPRWQVAGACWYLLAPNRGSAWGGPFNGQSARQALFNMIIERIQPCAIVETGTFLGTTTELMAKMGLPVFTIEADSLYCGFARARFWRNRRVRAICDDSRSALRTLSAGPLRSMVNSPVFFYLDAHWNTDLPLAEEIDIVFARCPSAIVMIDDFEVPDDPGYTYDDYGPEKTLNLSYLRTAIAVHRLVVYFPSTPSGAETGSRRGCVILADRAVHGAALDAIPLLAPHADEAWPDASVERLKEPEPEAT